MTTEEREEYNRKYKEGREKYSGNIHKYTIRDIFIKPDDNNFNGGLEVCCSHFGCGKILSSGEQLFGTKCQEHSGTKKQDYTMAFQHPHKKIA